MKTQLQGAIRKNPKAQKGKMKTSFTAKSYIQNYIGDVKHNRKLAISTRYISVLLSVINVYYR